MSWVPLLKGRTLEPNVVIPLIEDAPPTFKFFSIPTPPSTTNAPLSLVVDCVVFAIDVIPMMPNVPPIATYPPILASPPIPAPP